MIYDQYDNAGNLSSSSQNFEASNNQYDDELADDFVIPGGVGWNIQTVDVSGEYFNGPGPANSVNVNFYSNSGSNRPGTLLAARPNQNFTNGPSFSIPLMPQVSLGPGTYWVSVQANQNLDPGGSVGLEEPHGADEHERLLAEPGQRLRDGLHDVGCQGDLHRRPRRRRAGSGLPAARQRRAASASTAASASAPHRRRPATTRAGSRSTTRALRLRTRRPATSPG